MTAANDENVPQPLFELGDVVGTPGALRLLEAAGIEPSSLLQRHQYGDWSESPADDQFQNLLAVRDGARIFTSYRVGSGESAPRVWLITEADRSSTCLLRPGDY
jgi:hypothetical protein